MIKDLKLFPEKWNKTRFEKTWMPNGTTSAACFGKLGTKMQENYKMT
jgi:hypothetical protein